MYGSELPAVVISAGKLLRWSHTENVGQRPWGSAERICLSGLCCQSSTLEHSAHLENVRWLHSEVFVNIVFLEVRQERATKRLGPSLGSVTIFTWFVFPPRCLFYLSYCTFSVWVKMWADSDHRVARQPNVASVQARKVGFWVWFWLGFIFLRPVGPLYLPLIFLILCLPFSLPFFFLFPSLCLYDCTVEMCGASSSRSSSSREHLSKLCSVMTTQQWGNWADPEAKLLEGTGGKASRVRPSLSHPLSGHLALNH